MADYKITTKAARAKLPVRKAPYWTKLATGQHLGYVKRSDGESWIARYTGDDKKYQQHKLGENISFDKAGGAAREWFQEIEAAVDTQFTVGDAIGRYVDHLATEKGPRRAEQSRLTLRFHVGERMRATPIAKLTHDDLQDWMESKVATTDDDDQRRRSQATANRVWNSFKAALNYSKGKVGVNPPWREIKRYGKADTPRTLFLEPGQVRGLVEASTGAHRMLVEAAIHTGARFGELANAQVADFDPKARELHLSGKTGPRDCVLSDAAVTVIKRAAKDKLPGAWLFTDDLGRQWHKNTQGAATRAAVARAKLPRETVFYSLRHYHISRALLGGVLIHLVAKNTGTSVKVIEDFYAKFVPSDIRDMLNEVAL